MAEQVLVLGVGNILFSDEAIGVRTVEHLQQCASLPGNVELMDGGTLGIRLMDAIMGCDLLIVVDAVLGGGEPGTLYRLEGEGLRESMSFRDSMHQTDLVDTLIYCDLAGHRPDAVVIGMEPADYHTMEIGLTPVCQARLPDLAGKVVEELRALKPDVIAVVAYGKILPQRVLDIPKLGCINIHASILPALRGSAPIQWAILNGMEETGVTAMYMAAEMDAGDIIEIRKTPIDPFENAQSLRDRLAGIGAELLCDTLRTVEAGTARRTPQDGTKATFAPMLTKALCPVDWTKTMRQITDHVRGLNPWPVATAELAGTHFKIYSVRPTEKKSEKAPGTPVALTKRALEVACGDGVVEVLELQADGGKRMRAPDYFRGHPIEL